MNWTLKVDKLVSKQLKRIPNKDEVHIVAAIESLAVDPFTGDFQKMKGEPNTWRRRVGSYRIFYEVNFKLQVVTVLEVKRRTSNTY